MFQYDDTDIMNSSRDSYFDADFVYSNDLMFAFTITEYDEETEPIEDPSIATLKAYYKTWGLDNKIGTTWEEIPTRKCTEAELHIN